MRAHHLEKDRFVAKPIARHSGLGPSETPEYAELRERHEAKAAAVSGRRGPGSGAVDRTLSDLPLKPLYGPADVAHLDAAADLSVPGEFPYTRGIPIHDVPRAVVDDAAVRRIWKCQTDQRALSFFAGAGQCRVVGRLRHADAHGYDSDHPKARGEVGRCGVAIDSIHDMETLFAGIDMGAITTSMTINGPAAIALSQFIVAAENKGIRAPRWAERCRPTSSKNISRRKSGYSRPGRTWHHRRHDARLPRRDARVEYDLDQPDIIFARPVRPPPKSSRSRSPTASRTSKRRSQREWTSIAFCAAVIVLLQRAHRFLRGDRKIPGGPADLRAPDARRLRREGSRSWQLRFHTQTAGCSATAQQPENNIVRVAYEALSAVLGGTQSLHTNSMDEVLALPTEKNVEIALRTQQVLAYETNVTNVVDPLGG